MTVKRSGSGWGVYHGHAKKQGSKTDKPKGALIKRYTGPDAKAKAIRMHRAIMVNKTKKKH